MHTRKTAVLLCLAAVTAVPALAQELIRQTQDGGGGRSSAAGYVLQATIAQPDAGRSSAAGYVLHGGFWPGNGTSADAIFADGFD